jgi:hypothetical protein
MPSEYDKIKLKTGEIGRILEDLGDGSYIAEISLKTGEIDTTEIRLRDIASVFVETETPLSAVV